MTNKRFNLETRLGFPCLVSGFIENWTQNDEKGDFGVCLTNCHVNGVDWAEFTDHLWIYYDIDLWKKEKKTFGRIKSGRNVSCLGRVSKYRRADKSWDLGVKYDSRLVRLSQYLKVRSKMPLERRLQLHENSLIINDYKPSEEESLEDLRAIVTKDKAEIEQSLLRLSKGYGINLLGDAELNIKSAKRSEAKGFSENRAAISHD